MRGKGMENSQLVQVLRTFDSSEIREFRKWVCSPAHNQREDVSALFHYLTEKNHLWEATCLEKAAVFPKIYPEEKTYNDNKMRQSMHFLMRTLEEYLLFKEYQSDETYLHIVRARMYRKRNLEKPFLKSLRKWDQHSKKIELRNEHFFRAEYLLRQEEYKYQSEKKRTDQLNLQHVSDSVDISYLSDRLRQSCIMYSHQRVYKTDYQYSSTEWVLQYLNDHPGLLKHPAIAVYYHTFQMISQPNVGQHFHQLKQEVFENSHRFPHTEFRDIYLMMLNYCIFQVNKGEEAFIREAFDIYRLGLDRKVLLENNTLSRWTFRNIAVMGLRLKEFEYIYQFIQTFQKYISDKHRENMVNYCYAKFYYEKGQYNKAMKHLSMLETSDTLLVIHARILLMQVYFEQEEFDALDSLLDSFATYVRRKKDLGQQHRSLVSNFIRLTRRLTKVNPYSKKEVEQFREQVSQTKPLSVSERDWLLQQADHL